MSIAYIHLSRVLLKTRKNKLNGPRTRWLTPGRNQKAFKSLYVA